MKTTKPTISNVNTNITNEELSNNTFSGIIKFKQNETSTPSPVQVLFDKSQVICDLSNMIPDSKSHEICDSKYLKKGTFPVKSINNDSKPGFLLTDYYNLDDPAKPSLLPRETIESRIADSCTMTEILTNKIILDIFFIHQNWHIYKRGDGFLEYVKNNLPIGKSYVYDILKSVKLLIDYAENRLQWKKPDAANELNQINVQNEMKLLKTMSDPIEILGVTKLRVIAQFPKKLKYELLDSSMKSNISRRKLEALLADIRSQNRTDNEIEPHNLNEPGCIVEFSDNIMKIGSNGANIKFIQIPEDLKEQLISWIKMNIDKYINEF